MILQHGPRPPGIGHDPIELSHQDGLTHSRIGFEWRIRLDQFADGVPKIGRFARGMTQYLPQTGLPVLENTGARPPKMRRELLRALLKDRPIKRRTLVEGRCGQS